MNGILIAQPIAPLDSIVHVPSPIVRLHVPKGGVDATLGGNGVGPSGEQFGHTGGFEAGFREAHCGAEAGAACADYEGVVGVVDYGVVSCGRGARTGAGGGEGAGEMIAVDGLCGGSSGGQCEHLFGSFGCLKIICVFYQCGPLSSAQCIVIVLYLSSLLYCY
mmetsp:Transcript_24906/g.38195  ORF Transcript_24906/g.38195 Transcript_24906/m.38195 type:complete len:163 (+) Transcript_24906:756-1244(+)